MFGRFPDGPYFHFGTSRRNADYHFQVGGEQCPAFVDHPYESAYHHFGRIEVGDYSIAQGPYGFEAGMHPFVHHLRFFSVCYRFARRLVYRYYARLVHFYLVIHEYDGIGGSEVYCQFLC